MYFPIIPKSAITIMATDSTTGAALGPRIGSCLPPTVKDRTSLLGRCSVNCSLGMLLGGLEMYSYT